MPLSLTPRKKLLDVCQYVLYHSINFWEEQLNPKVVTEETSLDSSAKSYIDHEFFR